ncbi:NAD(P)H-hydrate epimerase [Rhodobacteraceae bacterium CYK-10]|uniref:Bifunctional NAD(P)H-hydrate repair enzyme n=2 Tax=Stagnihabitans tardus TaxID=2699202 RepID=A0AAE4YAK5_9RHOB|nr:NAD(P)H-hydrate epimerase [Stagnihabitans tardus]
MRAVEAEAIASGAVTGLELMERAGAGVVEAVFEEWPELALAPEVVPGQPPAPRRAVVLCGPGNNGGDGFVVARLLKGLGWAVEVYFYGDADKLPPDARVNYERCGGIAEVRAWDDAAQKQRFEADPLEFHLVVDAIFGTGMTRAMPEDTYLTWHGLMPLPLVPAHAPGEIRFVAIDLPSGVCSDSGHDFGAFPAHLTVTFHRPKIGHFMVENCLNYGGAPGCGKLAVVDIGLPRTHVVGAVKQAVPDIGGLKKSFGHKFSYGHAVVVSGPAGACGATRMTSRAALRVGAGLVTLACPAEAMAENAARLDAVMLKPLADAEALTALLSDARINALCLGPGLGLDARAAGLVRAALLASRSREVAKVGPGTAGRLGQGAEPRGIPRATQADSVAPDAGAVREDHAASRRLVLDADALTLVSRDPALFALLHEGCILTPHGGEFARLFPDLAARLSEPAVKGPAYSKVDATREAAARAGCTVLYKGPDTVIASANGTCAINAATYDRAAPWLATAGSGDVLAGLITGLLARGFHPQNAAETAAWLHVEAARAFGPGLIAEDLPEMIPKVFRDLGL